MIQEIKSENLSQYSGEVYSMSGGLSQKVRIRFADKLIGVIYDQYGEDVKIVCVEGNKCQCDIDVEISPIF